MHNSNSNNYVKVQFEHGKAQHEEILTFNDETKDETESAVRRARNLAEYHGANPLTAISVWRRTLHVPPSIPEIGVLDKAPDQLARGKAS